MQMRAQLEALINEMLNGQILLDEAVFQALVKIASENGISAEGIFSSPRPAAS